MGFGEAVVADLDLVVFNKYVGWFEVAVDDSGRMKIRNCGE